MKRMVWNREHSRLVHWLRAGDRRWKGDHLWADHAWRLPLESAFRHMTMSRRRRDVQRRARG